MDTQRFCLDRHWRFTQTPQSFLPKTIGHGTVYAFSKGDGAQGPAMLNFNDLGWQEVDLPHDWQHLEPYDMSAGIPSHGYQKAGVGWYRRTFLLNKEDEGSDIALDFGGVSGVCDLYVNGCKLRHNESCYNGFEVRITDIANFGVTPNVVALRVDKTSWEGWWYEGCGINRHVWLVKRPALHVEKDGVWIRPVCWEGAWHAEIAWTVENAGPRDLSGELRCEAVAPDGTVLAAPAQKVAVKAFSREEAHCTLPVPDAQLWDLDTPRLYTLRTALVSESGTDRRENRFGLREIRVDAQTGFWLNGRNVKLLGTCNHLDHAGIGAAIPRDLHAYRIGLLKRMGSNAYRCSHNPPPEELLDVCDELGMLVMDENRAFSTSEEALSLLRSMVRRDRNHPCVVMYSLFNEEPMQGTPKGRRLAQRQRAAVRALDPTRPVTGAMNGGMFEKDGAATVLDVTGINYFVDSYDRFHQLNPDQPLVSSEIVSAFATRGCARSDTTLQRFDNYDSARADWGESVREANTAVLSRPFVMGLFVWTGFDYRGEPTPYEWPSVSSHFGVHDLCGFPKDTAWLYRAFWTREPIVHLLPHWNHARSSRVNVMAYSNCEEVELFVGGTSVGRKANSPAEPCRWEVAFVPGELRAVGYRDGRAAAEDTVRTSGPASGLMLDVPTGTLYPDTDSVAVVNISCADEEGVFCPKEKARLTVTVTGGRLMGVGNGDPNCHDADADDRVRLFFGRAQAIVAATPGEKEVTVSVRGDKLGEKRIVIPVGERRFPPDLPSARIVTIAGWRVSRRPLSEKPDVADDGDPSDMNSMEPVAFTGGPQDHLSGFEDAYALYHAPADLGESVPGRYLLLNAVQGTVEVYAQRKLLKRAECPIKSRVVAPVPVELSGEATLTLIIQNRSIDKQAGIFEPVCLCFCADRAKEGEVE